MRYKKSGYKKKGYKKNYKKYSYKKRRPNTMGINFIKRKCLKTDIAINNPQQITLNFSLNDLPNSSDFTNLFDFYRICGVKLQFIFQSNNQDTGSNTVLSIPVMHYIADYDDSIGFSNENQALEKEGIKTKRIDKPFTYYLVPRISNEIYNNGITTAYALNNKKQWIDCNSSGVAHFGLKAWVSSGVNTITGQFKIYATYYLQFKGAQ